MQNLINFVTESGQLWEYESKLYRLIKKERGKCKMLPLTGTPNFRILDEMELIDKGILKNEFDVN